MVLVPLEALLLDKESLSSHNLLYIKDTAEFIIVHDLILTLGPALVPRVCLVLCSAPVTLALEV